MKHLVFCFSLLAFSAFSASEVRATPGDTGQQNPGLFQELNLSGETLAKNFQDLQRWKSSLEDNVNHNLREGWSFQLNEIQETDRTIRQNYADNASSTLDRDREGLEVGFTLSYEFD